MAERKIILVTGGQRSGKSAFSEKLAIESNLRAAYLATARILDDEFRERVRIHRQRRGQDWITIEEPMEPGKHDLTGYAVVFDCVTMWITNVFFAYEENVEKTLEFLKKEFLKFTEYPATFIFVSNEIGSGGIGGTPMQRKFTDVQGWFNQFIASHADEVYLTVSGIPLKIK